MKNLSIIPLFLIFLSCSGQEYEVTFKVNTKELDSPIDIGILGNISPLSTDKTQKMEDSDGDGIYEKTLTFNTKKKYVRFKFVNGKEVELKGADERIIWFKPKPVEGNYVFNEYNYYNQETIKRLVYTPKQVLEDFQVLKEVVTYIHPNIHGYRDSLSLQKDLDTLLKEMLANPYLPNLYKVVSKFAPKIKCSHTFTNPWNQGPDVKQAIFHQPDKIPFSFKRVGKNIFIEKNASDNPMLERGMEVLSINGVEIETIMKRLMGYVSSDGNNIFKKLERLLVTGNEKFALFDIFYPLEFDSSEKFVLRLRKNKEGEIFNTEVKAISKTRRTRIFQQRYGTVESSVREGWKFSILDQKTAVMALKSFAVQRNEFDWKELLDSYFDQLNRNMVENLIVDIRGNEGGQGEVGEYILERLIKQPLEIPAMESSVRYKVIPDHFKKHISTWDKFPYDFTSKIAREASGRYFLKDKYTVGGKLYKPKRNGFKGRAFLLTDASNSSATHLMAMYAKKIPNITIVGEETGGSVQGTNGNFIFFLRLPNSRIELDIPVVRMRVPLEYETQHEGGVIPNILVEKQAPSLQDHSDYQLQKILELIRNK